jgi:hypothetical protein
MRVDTTQGNPWEQAAPSGVGTGAAKESTTLLVNAGKEEVKKEVSSMMGFIQNGPMLLKTFNFLTCAAALAVSVFQASSPASHHRQRYLTSMQA